ncbi:MAG: hypothetical protein WBW28_25035, partial [Pseudolabrys sp.]
SRWRGARSRLDNRAAAHPGAPGSERQRKLDYVVAMCRASCPAAVQIDPAALPATNAGFARDAR